MHLGYVYGIVERNTGISHLCLYSRSLADNNGNLYEMNGDHATLFEFDGDCMDIHFELPIVDFLRYCEIKPSFSWEELSEKLNHEAIRKQYLRCADGLKNTKERLKNWDETHKDGRVKLIEKIDRLKEERDEWIKRYPYLASSDRKTKKEEGVASDASDC